MVAPTQVYKRGKDNQNEQNGSEICIQTCRSVLREGMRGIKSELTNQGQAAVFDTR